DDEPWRLHLKWSLLGTLRECAVVKVGWPYQRPGVARVPRQGDADRAFVRRARWMAEDLAATPAPSAAAVHHGDARMSVAWAAALDGRVAQGVVSSPPYLNNFDYADATRLELYFWGVARSWRDMTERV